MSETVMSDTFDPPWHKISTPVQNSLKSLLEEYESQFAQDETSIGTTLLTSMTIDTGTANPVSTETLPYNHETLWMGQEWRLKSYSLPR